MGFRAVVAVLLLPAVAFALAGRVERKGAPVAGAKVAVWPATSLDAFPCAGPKGSQSPMLCLCAPQPPDLDVLPVVKPLAETTSAADGTFKIEAAQGTWLEATSPDGTRAALVQGFAADQALELAALEPLKVYVRAAAGVDLARLSLVAFDAAGRPYKLEKREGGWVSQRAMPAGSKSVLAFAPGSRGEVATIWEGSGNNRITELVLRPPARLEGTVRLAGAPVVGAEVFADPTVCGEATKTDEKGHFQFENARAGTWRTSLEARSKGLVAHGTGQPGQAVVLDLVKPATLTVSLVQGAAPVAKIHMNLSWERADKKDHTSQSVVTDDKGRATVSFPGDGTVRVYVYSTWLVTGSSTFTVQAGKTVTGKLTAVKPVELQVELVDAQGKPVAGARLNAMPGPALAKQLGPENVRFSSLPTSTRGITVFQLVPGAYDVNVTTLYGAAFGKATAPGKLKLKLPPATLIGGDVVDEAGKPAANVEVMASPPSGRPWINAKTNDEGSFVLQATPGTWSVFASRQGAVLDGGSRQVTVSDGAVAAVSLVAPSSRRSSGVVVDEKGKPMADVDVFALPAPQAENPGKDPMREMMNRNQAIIIGKRTRSDEQGRIFFDGPPAIAVWANSERWTSGAHHVVLKSTIEGVIKLTARSLVKGRVLDRDGKPAAGASLGGVRTSADGTFELWADPGVDMGVIVQQQGHLDLQKTIKVVGKELALGDLQLKPSYPLTGTVVNAATGKPVPNVEVRGIGVAVFGYTDGNGAFSLSLAEPTEVPLYAKSNELISKVVPGRPGTSIEIRVEPFPSITLTLTDATGNPINGRRVEAVGPNPVDRPREYSDSFGVVRFKKLLPGKWTVTVEPPTGGKPTPIAIEVSPAQQLAQTVKLDERL